MAFLFNAGSPGATNRLFVSVRRDRTMSGRAGHAVIRVRHVGRQKNRLMFSGDTLRVINWHRIPFKSVTLPAPHLQDPSPVKWNPLPPRTWLLASPPAHPGPRQRGVRQAVQSSGRREKNRKYPSTNDALISSGRQKGRSPMVHVIAMCHVRVDGPGAGANQSRRSDHLA